MEIHYKINPEIKDFIIQKARERPELGCRKLSVLIQEVFKVNISKSSISTILKLEGLNKPAGRPSAKEKVTTSQVTGHRSQVTSYRPQVADKEELPQASQPPVIEQKDNVIILPELSLEQRQGTVKEEPEPEGALPNMGCWFLKAADLCLGGAQAISDRLSLIKPEGNGLPSDRQSHKKDDRESSDLASVTEALLYLPLFGVENFQDLDSIAAEALAILVGKKISCKNIQTHLDELEQVRAVNLQIFNQILSCKTEVLGVKFILQDGSFFFLDAGCHSIWTTSRIPEYFSAGLSKTRKYLNECILETAHPLILQAPPGFDVPTPAFLDFLASFQSEKPDKAIKRIELYSEDNLLIDTIQSQQKKRYFILGLWPWQYKSMSNCPQSLRGRSEATPSPVIARSDSDEAISKTGLLRLLRSLAMTNKDNQKVLTIITNLEEEKYDDKALIGHYLERWPNLETGYQDFLDKIGHFHRLTQTESRQKNNVQFTEGSSLTLSGIVNYWRQELNLYCQRYFFPLSYRKLDFLALKERFYNLRSRVISGVDYIEVIFELPGDFPHLKDLQYGCQRVNEADIHLRDRRKLSFEIG